MTDARVTTEKLEHYQRLAGTKELHHNGLVLILPEDLLSIIAAARHPRSGDGASGEGRPATDAIRQRIIDGLALDVSQFAMTKYCETVKAYLDDRASTSMESVGDAIYAHVQQLLDGAFIPAAPPPAAGPAENEPMKGGGHDRNTPQGSGNTTKLGSPSSAGPAPSPAPMAGETAREIARRVVNESVPVPIVSELSEAADVYPRLTDNIEIALMVERALVRFHQERAEIAEAALIGKEPKT